MENNNNINAMKYYLENLIVNNPKKVLLIMLVELALIILT